MRRTRIARWTHAAVCALCLAGVPPTSRAGDSSEPVPAPRAPAPAKAPSPADEEVRRFAGDLESPDTKTRTRASEALGARYPEAASAIQSLLDAVGDEAGEVSGAAVRSLLMLGVRGQDDATQILQTLPATAHAFFERTLARLGRTTGPVSAADFADAVLQARASGRDALRAALLLLAMNPFEFIETDMAHSVAYADAHGLIEVARPWLEDADPATRRTASAAIALLGRAEVSSPWGRRHVTDETESSPSLHMLLDRAAPVARMGAFLLLANGAPHAEGVRDRIMRASIRIPAANPTADADGVPGGQPGSEDARRGFTDDGLGGAAYEYLKSGCRKGRAVDRCAYAQLTPQRRHVLETIWAAEVTGWTTNDPTLPIKTDSIYTMGRDRDLTAVAVKSVPRIMDAFRARSEFSRALLTPLIPREPEDLILPPDPIPADRVTAVGGLDADTPPDPSIALAWLVSTAPPGVAPASLKFLGALTLRRALVAPDRLPERREAAAVLVDLRDGNIVPVETILAALQAPGTRRDGVAEIALLKALNFHYLGGRAIAPIAKSAERRPGDETSDGPAAWPHIEGALSVKVRGFAGELPTLRRLAAIDALGAVGDEKQKAKEVLAPLTKDPDPRVRYRAAKALRRLGP